MQAHPSAGQDLFPLHHCYLSQLPALFLLFLAVYLFSDWVLLYSSHWAGVCYVDQAGLQDEVFSCLCLLGLQVCTLSFQSIRSGSLYAVLVGLELAV